MAKIGDDAKKIVDGNGEGYKKPHKKGQEKRKAEKAQQNAQGKK